MALEPNPVSIELADIQGLLIRGYGQLPVSRFLLLQIEDAEAVRKWLHSLVPQITAATQFNKKHALNIAFTCEGLKAIGLADENVDNFPIPFRQGMATEWRQRILGDFGESAPQNWRWGGVDEKWEPTKHPHILLAMYGMDQETTGSTLPYSKGIHTGKSRLYGPVSAGWISARRQ